MVLDCHNNMNILSKNVIFEVPITCEDNDDAFTYYHHEFGEIQIRGRIDAVDEENIWEFKCVDNLTLEHKLQLIIYAWTWNKSNKSNIKKDFYLLNIKSGQTFKLIYNIYVIEEIIDLIFQDKFTHKKNIEDDEFINLCNKN